MTEIALMDPSKETENKLRWKADVAGVEFKLYIPKWRVPRPWPTRIIVSIRDFYGDEASARSRHSVGPRETAEVIDRPIVAVLDKRKQHTNTVRFTPRGDQKTWEIGEPYIPTSLSPEAPPDAVEIEVRWDRSEGTWSDE
jgi:hypothetical protein